MCEALPWRRENGALKDMSCRVALLRMHGDGLITLPPPRNPKPVAYRSYPDIEQAVGEPAVIPAIDLAALTCDPVLGRAESRLWNAYIQRHHYLGYQPIPGAQLRYFVHAEGHILAALGFGASARKVKPRDQAIGWTTEQRQRNLSHRQQCLLPDPAWIHCKHLASRILGLTAKRLPDNWQARYSYRPVLLETLVGKPRFTGACYQAANWRNVGDTQGRGKLDVLHRHAKPVKSIWIYPLARDFRKELCNG